MPNPFHFEPDTKRPPQGPPLEFPASAMIIGNAIGKNRNRAGVYGHSEQSIAIYGMSEVCAGWFVGDVVIDGELTVGGTLISNLIQRIDALETSNTDLLTRLSNLEASRLAGSGITFHGPSSVPTANRPVLNIKKSSPVFVQGVNWTFELEGTHFSPYSDPTFTVSVLPGQPNKNHAFTVLPHPGVQIVNAQGNLTAKLQIVGDKGDQVILSATQGLQDPNDATGLLHSNQLLITFTTP